MRPPLHRDNNKASGSNNLKAELLAPAPVTETETLRSSHQKMARAAEREPMPSPAPTPANTVSRPLSCADLYRAHAATVARWAARLGGPTIDVEDVVHEVFMVVERRLPEFRGDAKASTWLYRITDLVSRAHRRKARLRSWLTQKVQEDADFGFEASHLSPVESLMQRERTRLVYRALDVLGERYRSVFVLFEIEGLSGEEIAALTGLKLSTVWVRLLRARKKFVARLAVLREEQRP